jgi:hypothetical protein
MMHASGSVLFLHCRALTHDSRQETVSELQGQADQVRILEIVVDVVGAERAAGSAVR